MCVNYYSKTIVFDDNASKTTLTFNINKIKTSTIVLH